MEGFSPWYVLAIAVYAGVFYLTYRFRPPTVGSRAPDGESGLLGLAISFWLFGHLGAFIPWASGSAFAAHTVTAAVRFVGSLLILRCVTNPRGLGLGRPRPTWLPLWGLGCFVIYLPVLALLSQLRSDVVDQDAVRQVQAATDLLTQGALLISLVLVTPVFEELIFRGLLQRVLIRETGPGAGILITALVFMVIHPRGVWIDVFTLGILLGYAYQRTRSLYVPIAIHLANNALAFVVFTAA